MVITDRKTIIQGIAKAAANWRRELHQHPQTMYEEEFASSFIRQRLDECGIRYESGIARTEVVASIEGLPAAHRRIAFRADMDALPIQEEGDLPWKSHNPGKMHACGHDGHTASLLALACYLQQTRDFPGTVHLIFQPAEEGGRGEPNAGRGATRALSLRRNLRSSQLALYSER